MPKGDTNAGRRLAAIAHQIRNRFQVPVYLACGIAHEQTMPA